MGNIIINGTTFAVMNTSLVSAAQYLEAAIGPGADAWRALITAGNDDQAGRLLVQATRILYSLGWSGTLTDSTQKTAWPRNGATKSDGTTITDGTTPEQVIWAEAELAAQLAVNPTLPNATDAGSNIARIKAGPVELEYFKATTNNDTAIMLPKPVWDLVSPFLASSATITRSTSSGLCDESHFDRSGDVYPYTRNGPF
jgi:hypothetical protein